MANPVVGGRANAPTQPAVAAVEDPMTDPLKREQVEMAKTFIYHLLKGIKQIGMYRHMESKYGEFLAKAADAITAYGDKHGPLQLRVDVGNFLLHKQELFPEESPLPYKFFKDGIRQLIFRPGFTTEELISFTLCAVSDPDRGAEDINAQLWRLQLPHFEFIMVEGFKMDEFGEEEVQVEVDKVVDYLSRRLRADSDDYLRFARVSEEDLDGQLAGVEQMRGVVIAGVTADATMKARVQKEIEEEENTRLFPKLLAAVFQVVEAGVDDARILEDMFVQLLDAMLLQEDFGTINQVVLKLRAMVQRQGKDSPMSQLLDGFIGRMGEEQRLGRVADVLKTGKAKSPQDIIRYLTNLPGTIVPALLDVLEVVEVAENRTLICDVLVPFVKEHPEPFVNRLQSGRPQTVRDMIYVLDRANHPDKIKFFGTVLASKNLAIKLEAMQIIARGRTGEARKLISQCLADENKQVRITAARVLPEFDRDKAYMDLQKLVKEPAFEKRDDEEKKAFFTALGATGVSGAIAWFQQTLNTKAGLFNKAKVMEDKLLAIAGLIGACTIQTSKMMQEVSEDKSQPAEVQSAAKLGHLRTKKILFGDMEKDA